MEKYIPKSALVAEIEDRIKELQNLHKENEEKLDSIQKTAILLCIDECKVILSLLDTLGVKEVDLDKECRKYFTEHFNVYEDNTLQSKRSNMPLDTFDVMQVARHFYELGLKTKEE